MMARMEQDGVPRTTLSFYRYVRLENPDQTRNQLYAAWEGMGVLGRTYVASEGINAQISVPTDRFDEFKAHLDSLGWLPNLRLNVAVEQGKSFFKLIVRVKEKIVADGLNDDTFDVTDCGEHLKADQFNALTDHEDTVLIDMRNSYESEVGHFEGAICPDVNTFREEIVLVESMLQDKKDVNIVMYCTGGIRCEKASAYLKHKLAMVDRDRIYYAVSSMGLVWGGDVLTALWSIKAPKLIFSLIRFDCSNHLAVISNNRN